MAHLRSYVTCCICSVANVEFCLLVVYHFLISFLKIAVVFPGVETFVDNKIGIIEFYDLQLAVTRLCFDDGIKRILILGGTITDGVELFRIESG